MVWLKRAAMLVTALLFAGFAYQQWSEARDAKRYPPPGQLIAVGNHRLHLWCIGEGSPTVVMISGGGTPSVTLYPAQQRIAKVTRVCSYDRAGLGWSDAASKPMNLTDLVVDLETLLALGKVEGPLVLAPESFGGLIAASYWAQNPDRVAGVVMIDASEPELFFRATPSLVPELERKGVLWQIGWRLGIIRAAIPFAAPNWIENWSPENKGQFFAIWSRPIAGYASDTVDVVKLTPKNQIPATTANILGDKPLIILQHGKTDEWPLPPAFEAGWPGAQAKLAKLSSAGQLVIAKDNGHPIAEENPELVAASVKAVVDTIRSDAK